MTPSFPFAPSLLTPWNPYCYLHRPFFLFLPTTAHSFSATWEVLCPSFVPSLSEISPLNKQPQPLPMDFRLDFVFGVLLFHTGFWFNFFDQVMSLLLDQFKKDLSYPLIDTPIHIHPTPPQGNLVTGLPGKGRVHRRGEETFYMEKTPPLSF